MHSGAKFSLGKDNRLGDYGNLKEATKKPGAGTYDLNQKNAGPSFGFGTSKRSDLATHGVPGPGQYKVPTKVVDTALYSNSRPPEQFKFV